jgi:hypothetical protein
MLELEQWNSALSSITGTLVRGTGASQQPTASICWRLAPIPAPGRRWQNGGGAGEEQVVHAG